MFKTISMSVLFFAAVLLGADAQSHDEDSYLTYTGLYVKGFETSLFIPCDDRQEEWWLSFEDTVDAKMARSLDLSGSLLTVLAHVTPDSETRMHKLASHGLGDWRDRADLSEEDARYILRSGYGHLGAYDREIKVVALLDHKKDMSAVESDMDFNEDIISMSGMNAIRQSNLEAECPSS